MLYPSKIEKSLISTLPPCDITGEIIVIDRPEDVATAVDDLKQCTLIGFDTETRPSFRRGESNTISLLQLATDKWCETKREARTGNDEGIDDIVHKRRCRQFLGAVPAHHERVGQSCDDAAQLPYDDGDGKGDDVAIVASVSA